jgi:hypothetical protein
MTLTATKYLSAIGPACGRINLLAPMLWWSTIGTDESRRVCPETTENDGVMEIEMAVGLSDTTAGAEGVLLWEEVNAI